MLEGYPDRVDDACSVTVATSDLYGGAISFEIRGVEKLTVEERRVDSDLKPGKPVVKWVSPGSSNAPIEIVVLNLRDDGSLKSLRLMPKDALRHQEKSLSVMNLCGGTRGRCLKLPRRGPSPDPAHTSPLPPPVPR
jgi:hypothetical protein